ncbi:MAG: T9SS type A sorting domain-containing protein [bacterium]|nr:T9SS type A sorting domain-containing protein [bacterium]
MSLFFLTFSTNEIKPQIVIGKLVDENGVGLANIELQLYITTNVYNTTSDTAGYFTFNNIITVQDEFLPLGYSVSNNYPNPFNPTTRFVITIPVSGIVKVEVFNLLGQIVLDVTEKTFDAGTNYIDIELNGLPNGFYISRITIDDKYVVVKKMMLIYGSQHLTTIGSPINIPLNKSNNTYLVTKIDSLVATSSIIGRKTFSNLPGITSDTLDLGNLAIERFCPDCPTVLYEGKTYHTVKIGTQCWLKENLEAGIYIPGSQNATNNGIIEKYCYNNDPNNCNTYGGLYHWNEAMQYITSNAQGICPPGWHIPTLSELLTLRATVNNDGNALKAVGQGIGSGAGTNISGFSALLAGYRYGNGVFYGLGEGTLFWGSTESSSEAYILSLGSEGGDIYIYSTDKSFGFSVRCLKD